VRGHHVQASYHAGLLSDPARLQAYDRALAALVEPGDVVLDVGTGTGILAMLAARHGAARVHAVESGAIVDVARALVQANHLSDRITVHHADLVELDPVEPVDLVIGDWLGRFVVDDEMLDAVAAARAWARDGARFCPESVDLHLGLMAGAVPSLTRWAIPLRGLDLSPALPLARSQPVPVQVPGQALVGTGTRAHTLLPGDAVLPPVEARLLNTQNTAMFAVLGWFRAHLAPGVVLDTGPGHPTHWGQIAWPVPPTPLQPGDVVHATVQAEGSEWRWSVRVSRRGQVVLDHQAHSAERPLDPGAPVPGDLEAATQAGQQALQAGDLNSAISHLGGVTRALPPGDPRSPDAFARFGVALARAGLLKESVDALLTAVRDTSEPTALAWLPAVTARLGQAEEAERWRREHLRHVGPWQDPLG